MNSPHNAAPPPARASVDRTNLAAPDLFIASALGLTLCAARILFRDPALARAVDRDGRTPLHHAARAGHRSVAAMLLAFGAEIDAATPLGATALHLAAAHGHTDLARLLLRFGADPRARDLWRKTPRERALELGDRAMGRLLK